MVDYASTKGAIVGFTRSLATNLISKGIRVNAVAYVSGSQSIRSVVDNHDSLKTRRHLHPYPG
jgi:NAD(P)-dependent dehydrogenase (short-subunit alcohol dehydrogenase family)